MTRILGSATARTEEDPFGPGDPVEVARLVRCALAGAGRRAVDVAALVLVAEQVPDSGSLARFTRRALGPAGDDVASRAQVMPGTHAERCAAVAEVQTNSLTARRVTIALVLGPGSEATAMCLGQDRA